MNKNFTSDQNEKIGYYLVLIFGIWSLVLIFEKISLKVSEWPEFGPIFVPLAKNLPEFWIFQARKWPEKFIFASRMLEKIIGSPDNAVRVIKPKRPLIGIIDYN